MRNWRSIFLCLVILVVVSCNANPPYGQIMISNDGKDSKFFYAYDFSSEELQKKWELTEGISFLQYTWSPDFKWITYSCVIDHQENICLQKRGEADIRVLLIENNEIRPSIDTPLTWTPNGESITFISKKDSLQRQTVYNANRDTGELTALLELPNALGDIVSLEWLSSDKLLTGFVRDFYDGDILVWDIKTKLPTKLTEGLYPTWSSTAKQIIFMRIKVCLSEQACFFKNPDSDMTTTKRVMLYAIDSDGKNEILLYETSYITDPFMEVAPEYRFCPSKGFTWSPDGKYIAFLESCYESDPSDLYILQVLDGQLERIVKGIDFMPGSISWIMNSAEQ